MILIDKNLSPKIARQLAPIFPGMTHVNEVSLDKADDLIIWNYAQHHRLHLLTKDSDFNDIQSLLGFPPKIIWLRCGNVSTKYIAELLTTNATRLIAFLDNASLGIIEIR